MKIGKIVTNTTKRVIIDYDDFESLIEGKIVKKGDVEIALSDIGHLAMVDLILSQIDK